MQTLQPKIVLDFTLPDGTRASAKRGRPLIVAFAPDEWNPARAASGELYASLAAQFGADIRLPGMVYASIAHGPYGGARAAKMTTADAEAVPGVMAVLTNPGWVAVAGTNWWAADRGLQALAVEFETAGLSPNDMTVQRALTAALDGGDAGRLLDRWVEVSTRLR